MGADLARCGESRPVDVQEIATFRRARSAVSALLSRWDDGRVSPTIAFFGASGGTGRSTFINFIGWDEWSRAVEAFGRVMPAELLRVLIGRLGDVLEAKESAGSEGEP